MKNVNTSSIGDSMQANESNRATMNKLESLITQFAHKEDTKNNISDHLRNQYMEKNDQTVNSQKNLGITNLLKNFAYLDSEDNTPLTKTNIDWGLCNKFLCAYLCAPLRLNSLRKSAPKSAQFCEKSFIEISKKSVQIRQISHICVPFKNFAHLCASLCLTLRLISAQLCV